MTSSIYCSQTFYQTIKDGMQEIIGPEGMHTVIDAQQDFGICSQFLQLSSANSNEMTVLFASLEKVFGRLAGQGIAQRSGRVSFEYLSRQPELHNAFSDMAKRLLPVPTRIKEGLEILSGSVASQCGVQIIVSEDDQNWYWRIDSCPWCTGRIGETRGCYFLIGLVQEFTAWMSGGRFFDVTEVGCCAAEDAACLIQIGKRPLE